MGAYKNYGTIKTQKFVEEFYWNNKLFYTYLITFNEYEGYYKIVRESRHEQALIGAVMLFNYCEDIDQIKGYKIAGYSEKMNEIYNN